MSDRSSAGRRLIEGAGHRWAGRASALVALLAIGTGSGAIEAAPGAGPTIRISLAADGRQGNGDSVPLAISDDGRLVLTTTFATNIVGSAGGPTWGKLALHDRRSGGVRRADVGPTGSAAGGIPGVNSGSMTPDGRFAVFSTDRPGLVPGDTDDKYDLFIRDLVAGTTARLRPGVGGTLSQGTVGPYELGISTDGRYVMFLSGATNLLPGGSGGQHVYVHDRQERVTVQVDRGRGGAQADELSYGGEISAGGGFAAFESLAGNLVASDSNGKIDVFLRDLGAGTTAIVSIGERGQESRGTSNNPKVSGNGRFVAFNSTASNLVAGDTNNRSDVFVRDMQAGTTQRVSVGSAERQSNGRSYVMDLSTNGRYVTFYTYATNLGSLPDTNREPDVYVRDLVSQTTRRVSVGRNGTSANGLSVYAFVAANGTVAFGSRASNLVQGDTNGHDDTFVRDATR